MFTIKRKEEHGNINHGWLNTYHHFSFANFFDPNKMGFGPLRVLNDDYINGKTGFDMHPHRDMEIITYVIDGTLTHRDSLHNERSVTRGQVQYMSAGSGIMHSEHNNADETLRLLQIWILPASTGGIPNYGDYLFEPDERKDKWLHFVGEDKIKLNQDVNFYVIETTKPYEFDVEIGRQIYLVNIEGNTLVNDSILKQGDSLMASSMKLTFTPEGSSHVLLIEMKGE